MIANTINDDRTVAGGGDGFNEKERCNGDRK